MTARPREPARSFATALIHLGGTLAAVPAPRATAPCVSPIDTTQLLNPLSWVVAVLPSSAVT